MFTKVKIILSCILILLFVFFFFKVRYLEEQKKHLEAEKNALNEKAEFLMESINEYAEKEREASAKRTELDDVVRSLKDNFWNTPFDVDDPVVARLRKD